MSDTPETDFLSKSTDYNALGYGIMTTHARKLERERDEARKHLKEIGEYGTDEINAAIDLRQKLATALVERDEAREELHDIRLNLDEDANGYTLLHAVCALQNERDEADRSLEKEKIALNYIIKRAIETERERDEIRERHNQTILEKDRWRNCAEQKIALRRELESLLEIDSKSPSDEQFKKGISEIKKIIDDRNKWKECAERLYNSSGWHDEWPIAVQHYKKLKKNEK